MACCFLYMSFQRQCSSALTWRTAKLQRGPSIVMSCRSIVLQGSRCSQRHASAYIVMVAADPAHWVDWAAGPPEGPRPCPGCGPRLRISLLPGILSSYLCMLRPKFCIGVPWRSPSSLQDPPALQPCHNLGTVTTSPLQYSQLFCGDCWWLSHTLLPAAGHAGQRAPAVRGGHAGAGGAPPPPLPRLGRLLHPRRPQNRRRYDALYHAWLMTTFRCACSSTDASVGRLSHCSLPNVKAGASVLSIDTQHRLVRRDTSGLAIQH